MIGARATAVAMTCFMFDPPCSCPIVRHGGRRPPGLARSVHHDGGNKPQEQDHAEHRECEQSPSALMSRPARCLGGQRLASSLQHGERITVL